MRKIVILLAFAFCQTTQAQQCTFEKSNGLESATYFEAIDWYKNLDKKLTDLFDQGGMVITSYTLPWLIDDGVKIWLEGSHASSTKRMQSRDNMSSENAYEITKARFDKNKALYKKLYGFSFGDDKKVFDVIINTDNLTANQVIDVTTETVRKLL